MSKKRKKGKSSSASKYADRKSFETDGVSTPAFVAGMVTTLLLILMTMSHFSTRKATARVVERVGSGKSTESVVSMKAKVFDKVLESATAEQLNNILLGLNDWPRGSEVPVQIQANRRRVEVANQMLTLALDREQRELAIKSKIDALSAIYGVDFLNKLNQPNIAETLRAAATEYLDDANPRISRTARLAKLKHDAFEVAKHQYRGDLSPIGEQICRLLEDYPEDDVVRSTVKLIIAYYHGSSPADGQNKGVTLVRMLEANRDRFKSPQVQEMIREFSDEASLADVDFYQIYNDRWVNGSQGQKQLLETSVDLISRPETGEVMIANVDRVAHWFEQINEYQIAIQIYNDMLKSADVYQNSEAAEIARMTAKDGLRRSNLVNQEVMLQGAAPDGSTVTPKAFEDKVVVVVFWSHQNRQSVDSLRQINTDGKNWREKGIEIVGVCVDQELDNELKVLVSSYPRIQFLARDSDDRISILEQCPSSETPRAMLIDKNGKVVDVNVPILELKTEAEYLVSLDVE